MSQKEGQARLFIDWKAVARYAKDQRPPLNTKQALSKIVMENLPAKYLHGAEAEAELAKEGK